MYRADDHYWIIGGDEAQVWSSKRAGYVPVSDADYVAWLLGNGPTHIATMQELEQVFVAQYPRGALTTYTWYRRWRMEQAGITLASGMPIKTDDRAQAKISGAYLAAQISTTVTTPWQAADNTVHNLTAADIEAMNVELLTHINRAFSISADAIAQIDAGTITTIEQIDALFDAQMTSAQKDWLRKQ
jgi:uncharacterized protein DUF4376